MIKRGYSDSSKSCKEPESLGFWEREDYECFNLLLFTSPFFNSFQVDLADIKSEFQKKTGKTLKAAIQDELKGDLEQLLLKIIGD